MPACTERLTFKAHFFINQRREQDKRHFVKAFIFAHKFKQSVTVHFRHLNIRNDNADVIFNRSFLRRKISKIIPRVLTVAEVADKSVARIVQSCNQQVTQHCRIFRNDNVNIRAQSFNIGGNFFNSCQLRVNFGINFRDNRFKVQK